MRQLTRIVRYVLPYSVQLLAGIILLAGVGFLEAFRLDPDQADPRSGAEAGGGRRKRAVVHDSRYPPCGLPARVRADAFSRQRLDDRGLRSGRLVDPSRGLRLRRVHYLVNHAGFGMITNLRNDLYNSLLKRSAAFFQKHTTGTLISTIINDIERVQYAMSSVLAEFLQQLFTFLFTAATVVIVLGRHLAWILLLFIPIIIFLGSTHRPPRPGATTRGGQDKLADIQNVIQETIAGNRIVKAFSMESWGNGALSARPAQRLASRQLCALWPHPA